MIAYKATVPPTFYKELLAQSKCELTSPEATAFLNNIKNHNFEKALQALKTLELPESIQEMLTILLLFEQEEFAQAITRFKKLSKKAPCPKQLCYIIGNACIANGKHHDAYQILRRIYPYEEYFPGLDFHYAELLKEELFPEEALHIYLNMLKKASIHNIAREEMINCYLYLCDTEISLELQEEVSKHLDAFYQWLKHSMPFTVSEQTEIAEAIVGLSTRRKKKWFSQLFLAFVKKIDDLHVLTHSAQYEAISSAYETQEPYDYDQDPNVPEAIKGYFEIVRNYPPRSGEYLSTKWCLFYAFQQEPECIPYIESHYPNTYEKLLPVIQDIQKNKEEFEKNLLGQLKPFMVKPMDVETIKKSMISFYNQGYGKAKLGKKVGPNDPCPCGSGKKYKKCCKFKKN